MSLYGHTLTTERLFLRPARKDDLQALYTCWIRPEVRRFLWDDEVIPLQRVADVLEQNENLHREAHYGLWLIYRKWDHQSLIGFTGLWHFFEGKDPQLLYGLNGDFWNQGYALEAAAKVTDYAFAELGFQELAAAIDPPNSDSAKVLERLGFTFWKEEMHDGQLARFYRKQAKP